MADETESPAVEEAAPAVEAPAEGPAVEAVVVEAAPVEAPAEGPVAEEAAPAAEAAAPPAEEATEEAVEVAVSEPVVDSNTVSATESVDNAEQDTDNGTGETGTEGGPAKTSVTAAETSSALTPAPESAPTPQAPGTPVSEVTPPSEPQTAALEAPEQQSEEKLWEDLLTNNPIVKLFALIASLFLGGEQQAQTTAVLEGSAKPATQDSAIESAGSQAEQSETPVNDGKGGSPINSGIEM